MLFDLTHPRSEPNQTKKIAFLRFTCQDGARHYYWIVENLFCFSCPGEGQIYEPWEPNMASSELTSRTESSWGGSAAQDLLLSRVYKIRAQRGSTPSGLPSLWGKRLASVRERRREAGEDPWPSRPQGPALLSLSSALTVRLKPPSSPQS